MHVCVKMISKGSKETLTVLIVTHVTQVERVKSGVCGFYTTLHTKKKLKESKVVFAAFTQHCIQSYSICYSC